MEIFAKIWDRVSREWHVIAGAKVVFGLALVLGVGVSSVAIWQVLAWHYDGSEEALNSTIQNKQSQIDSLREELKGASPQLAAIQSRRDGIRAKLLGFYALPPDFFVDGKTGSPKSAQLVIAAENKWENDVSMFVKNNLGDAAYERIIDTTGCNITGRVDYPIYSDSSDFDPMKFPCIRKNLETIIETSAYDQ